MLGIKIAYCFYKTLIYRYTHIIIAYASVYAAQLATGEKLTNFYSVEWFVSKGIPEKQLKCLATEIVMSCDFRSLIKVISNIKKRIQLQNST